MQGKIYVTKRHSEKKNKDYLTTILELNGNEIMISIDKYYMLLLSKLTPFELESVPVGWKSEIKVFDL